MDDLRKILDLFTGIVELFTGIVSLFTAFKVLFRFVKWGYGFFVQLSDKRMIEKAYKEVWGTPYRAEYSTSPNFIRGVCAIRKTGFHAVTGKKLFETDFQRIAGVLVAQSV